MFKGRSLWLQKLFLQWTGYSMNELRPKCFLVQWRCSARCAYLEPVPAIARSGGWCGTRLGSYKLTLPRTAWEAAMSSGVAIIERRAAEIVPAQPPRLPDSAWRGLVVGSPGTELEFAL